MEQNGQNYQPTTKLGKIREIFTDHPSMLIVVFILIVILIILIVVSFKTIWRTNPYGREIEIENIDSVENLSTDEHDRITAELYTVVDDNTDDAVDLEKVKVKIREGSMEKVNTYRSKTYGRTFIVDIEELRQSYMVSLEWPATDDKTVTPSGGYPTAVTCLMDPEEIIYPEFECKDFITETLGTGLPLVRYLPIDTEDYGLYAVANSAEKPVIQADILIHSFQTPYTEKDQKAEEVKAKIIEKIKSLGANPDDYEIRYEVEYGD